MTFQVNNNLWKRRTQHGRKTEYTPDELWIESCEYFKWVEENPLYEQRLFNVAGKLEKESLPKMRAMSISALCIYLDISRSTWLAYSQRAEFLNIVEKVEGIIYNQKFEGAAADMLNSNIIARELGLADKKVLEDKRELTPWSGLDCDDDEDE